MDLAPNIVPGGAIARVDGGRILLNTGPSSHGWWRLEAWGRCPQLYSYLVNLRVKFPPTMPLIRGTIAHVGLAHFYARLRETHKLLRHEPGNPDRYYDPVTAMRMVATQLDSENGTDQASSLMQTYERIVPAYELAFGNERLKVLHVEEVFEAQVYGHRFTQRVDVVLEDLNGRVFLVDHKTAFRPDERTVAAYSLSGQFLGLQWFGHQIYKERFGGVRINFLSREEEPFEFVRKSPSPAPWLLARFPELVREREEQILAQVAAGRDPWKYPAAMSDLVCVHRYGKCAGYDLCSWGPA